MTSTEFSARYRILRRIAQDGVRSFTAQQVATQRPVMVHFLDQTPADLRADVLTRIDHLGAADRGRVVERLEVDGAPVIVTQILSTFESLPSWLSARTSTAQTSDASASAAGVESEVPLATQHDPPQPPLERGTTKRAGSSASGSSTARAPGEFTRLFGATSSPGLETDADAERPRPPAPSPARDAPTAPMARVEPQPAPPSARVEPPPAPAPPIARVEPAPSPPIARIEPQSHPTPPPRPAPKIEPGEFTRMFRQASPPPRPEPSPMRSDPMDLLGAAPASPLAPAPPRGAAPRSATGALDARPRPIEPPRPRDTPPAPPAAASPGEVPLDFPPPLPPSFATPADNRPHVTTPPRAAPPPGVDLGSPQMPSAAPGLPPGPSEFTRVIAGASPSPAAGAGVTPRPAAPANVQTPTEAPAQQPTPAPGTGSRPMLIPLLLGLNVIVLIAIALVLYFALSR